MIHGLSNNMGKYLLKNSIIEEKEEAIYIYGCELFLNTCVNIIVALIIGCVFHKLLEIILFLIVFSSIRVHAGGYHAASHMKCIIIFNSSILAVLIGSPYYLQAGSGIISGMLGCACIIWYMAPIEDPNKPLDQNEEDIYRIKTRRKIIFFVSIILSNYLLLPQMRPYILYPALSIYGIVILIIFGYIKNRMLKHKEKV